MTTGHAKSFVRFPTSQDTPAPGTFGNCPVLTCFLVEKAGRLATGVVGSAIIAYRIGVAVAPHAQRRNDLMAAVAHAIKRHKDLDTLLELRQQLESHPVFDNLRTLNDLRDFMSAHVFAVWDFMSLLKRLQRDLTCVGVPWIPRGDRVAAHLINEIVLGEESDIAPNGEPASHLELYRDAMREVGADAVPFDHFLQLAAAGTSTGEALRLARVPSHISAFVEHTMEIALNGTTLAVMASFFHGRENVIPRMFTALLQRWRIDEDRAPTFVFYLKRHIELDSDSHGPMAQRIIDRLCADDPRRRDAVLRAAIDSVRARIALWNGVHSSLMNAESARAG